MRTLIRLLAATSLLTAVWAHNISPPDGTVITLTYGGPSATISVTHSAGEGCVVTASARENAAAGHSPILTVSAGAQPALDVSLSVSASRPPAGSSETTSLQLTWAATGADTSGQMNPDCNGGGTATYTVIVNATGGGTTTANNPAATTTPTDPVDLGSGEFFLEEKPDLVLTGPMPIVFTRYYASRLKSDGVSPGALGDNWSHTFSFSLTPAAAGGGVTVRDNHGRLLTFQSSGSGFTLVSPSFAGYQLVQTAGGYTLGDPIEDRFYNFNTSGVLISIQDRNGNTHMLTYTSGNLTQIADGLGGALTFTYDSSNRINNITDGSRTVRFSYTGTTLTSFADARGNITLYAYNASSQMTQKTLPRGNVVTAQTWDSFGRVATQADGNGNTWRFTYNSDGSTTAADPAGHTRRYAFNSSGSLLSFTNENGATQTYTYDAAGRRNSYTDSLGHQGHFTFDAASGKLATYTEPDSSTSSYTYSAQIQAGITFRVLTRVSHPDGTTHQFTYDPSGNLLTMVDQAGKTISFTYNSAGQVLTMTNPAGGVTTLTYAADGTVSTITDAAGNTTALGHDAVRRLNLVIHPDGTTRSYVLDPSDQMVSDTDERGKTARFAYDVNGNLTSITDPLGNVTSIGYDALDRPVSATDAIGNKVSRTYDSVGRIASRTDRNGNTFTYSYDAAGNRTGVTDPGGSTWRRTYDSEGFPLSYTDPLNNTWTYNHDAFGRVVKSTSPAGAIFSLGYDISGRLSSLTDPSTNVTTFSADPRGLLAGIRQAGGVVASAFARTDLGQVSQVIDPNGQIWRHGYDSRGRTVNSIDPLGAVTSLTYNNMNRVTQVAFPGGLGSLQLTYDAQGNIVRKLYSDGTDLSFAFDDAERPVSAIGLSFGYDAMGEITSNNGLTVTRDSAGRITVISYGPGKNVNYTYDNQNRLIGVTDWLTGVTRFTYDAASRRTSNLRIDGSEVDFTYNADGFLTGMKDAASTTLASITLQRDARGQITSATRNVPLAPVLSDSWLPLSYDADSQVSVFTYDALGRLTNDVNRTYSWDLASRLTSYADVLGSVSFTYDAFGRRISRTSGGQTQNYVWNYALDLPSVSVIRQNGNDLRYYVYTPSGELLYSIEAAGNARHYYHFDETGNTLFLTNDTGAITDTYAYSPYGVPLGRTGTTDNPFTYGGEQGLMQETPSGLYYVRSRYYDAPTARFISRDPARRSAAPNETNPYTFVRMNPLLFTDPTGLNAQVNGDLTDTMGHTDISVDVWQGDQIIGTLNASFGEGGYRRRKNNSSDDSSSGGVLFNGQGTFNVSFQPGTCISSSGGSQTVFVPGSREQDERTAQAILNSVDWGSINKPQYQAGTPAGAFLKQLLKNQPTATGNTASVLHLSTVKGSGDWTKYGVIYPMRTCNTFTGSMLNVYFGESNTTGVMASSVKDNLDEHKVNVDIQKANSPTVRPFPGTEGGDNIVIWMDYPK